MSSGLGTKFPGLGSKELSKEHSKSNNSSSSTAVAAVQLVVAVPVPGVPVVVAGG